MAVGHVSHSRNPNACLEIRTYLVDVILTMNDLYMMSLYSSISCTGVGRIAKNVDVSNGSLGLEPVFLVPGDGSATRERHPTERPFLARFGVRIM